jgi:hypothetical protein
VNKALTKYYNNIPCFFENQFLGFVSLLRFCVPPDTTTNSPENFSGDLAESCRAVGEGVLLEMGE